MWRSGRQMRFDTLGRLTDFSMDRNALVESGNRFRLPAVLDIINDISACNRPYGDSMLMDILLVPVGTERA